MRVVVIYGFVWNNRCQNVVFLHSYNMFDTRQRMRKCSAEITAKTICVTYDKIGCTINIKGVVDRKTIHIVQVVIKRRNHQIKRYLIKFHAWFCGNSCAKPHLICVSAKSFEIYSFIRLQTPHCQMVKWHTDSLPFLSQNRTVCANKTQIYACCPLYRMVVCAYSRVFYSKTRWFFADTTKS